MLRYLFFYVVIFKSILCNFVLFILFKHKYEQFYLLYILYVKKCWMMVLQETGRAVRLC